MRDNRLKSYMMLITSMLIFGTIGIFRRYIPVSSAFLACSRGLLGGLCILLFARLNAGAKESLCPGGKSYLSQTLVPLDTAMGINRLPSAAKPEIATNRLPAVAFRES